MNYEELWKEFKEMIEMSYHDKWSRFEILDAMSCMEREKVEK